MLHEKFQYGHKDDLRKIISNTVISKLQCVCHTQSCDPPRDLDVI
jgi:hypothetical protein